MMVSDYDGSWEAYIDEFAEMILSGLERSGRASIRVPAGRGPRSAGFKQSLRNHQVPAEVFYSAYPEETVLNILGDRAFARACADAGAGRVRCRPARNGCDVGDRDAAARRRPRRHSGLHCEWLRPPVACRVPSSSRSMTPAAATVAPQLLLAPAITVGAARGRWRRPARR